MLYVASDQTLAEPHGGTVHVRSVSRELSHLGHEMHVLYQQSAENPGVPGGVTGHLLPQTHRFLLWTHGPEIERILDQVQPEVVIERYYNFAGETLLRAARRNIPTVLEVNSPMLEYKGSWKSKIDTLLLGALRKRRERMADQASLILAPVREIVPAAFREKVRQIEWGADTEEFDPAQLPDRALLRMEKGFSPDEFLMVHFGSLRKWHGLVKLLEAFDTARSGFQRPVKLIIIGPGKPIPRENVHFTGAIVHADIPGWLKMCDLAVLPFSPEQHRYLELGFYWSPLKVFEAMSMELPALTLRNPRLQSILGLEDERFFYDGSQQDLADRMVNLVNSGEDVLRSTGMALRERALRLYSWRAHAQQISEWLTGISAPRALPQ